MGKNAVNIRISGDSGDAQRSWLELIGVLKQTQNEIAKMGQKLEKASDRGTKATEKQLTALQKLHKSFNMLRNANAIIGGLRTAMGLFTAEIDSAVEAQRRLTEPRRTYEQAKDRLLMNVSAGEYTAIIKQIETYGGGIDRAGIINAASAAGSTVSLGMSKVDTARAAVDTAVAYPSLRPTPEDLTPILTAAIQIWNSSPKYQTRDAQGQPTFKKALEFLQVAQQKSAQYQPEKFGRNVVPAASLMMMKYGYSPEDAFAKLAATQTLATDVTGRMGSRTMLITTGQLAEIGKRNNIGRMENPDEWNVPAVEKWLRSGTPEANKARRDLLGVLDNTIAKELGTETYKGKGGALQGAAKYKPIMSDLIQGVGRVAELYRGAKEGLTESAVLGSMAAKKRIRDTDKGFALTRRDDAFAAYAGESQEQPTPKLTYEEMAKNREDILARTGITGFSAGVERTMDAIDWGLGMSPREILRGRIIRSITGKAYDTGEVDTMTAEDVMASNRSPEEKQIVLELLNLWRDVVVNGMPVRGVDDNGAVPSPSPAESLSE